ncbi:MAG: hypothetical protein JW715_03585 [Sedimentisphaerales bacterium]|nr:hypothetical protein [Sedimentisphaerales bacterium]
MPDPTPKRITSKKVIAVEGQDEKNFFDKLLKYLGFLDFQIEDVGGKGNFPDKFPALLKTTGFFNADGSPFVTHLVIIRDKDKDQAFKSIVGIVRKENLTPPENNGQFSEANPKVGIFIMPGDTVEGTMLEDLCLKTVEDHPAMKCVNEFASCVSNLPAPPKNISKSKATVFKALTFLATQPENVDCVGLAAQKNYWNFDSPVLDELKQFLNNLK